MFAGMVSKLAAATAAAAAVFAFGVGLPTPLGSGVAAAQGPCGSVGVPAAESSSTCEQQRDLCMDMHRAEDVRGNGYIPADAWQTCMDAYWYCKGQG